MRSISSGWRTSAGAIALVLALAACGGADGEQTARETEDSPDSTMGSGEDTEEPDDNAATEIEPATIRYATIVGENDTFAQQAQWFMEEVTERTGGAIDFETHYGGSLLGPTEIFAGIADNRTDAGHLANVYAPAELPLSQLTLPFVSRNGEAAAFALQDMYENNDAFRSEWESANIVPLAWAIVTSAAAGTAEPISSLDDLDGQRLRAVGSVGLALQEIGVDPVTLGITEIYESIERGVLDGFTGLPFQTAIEAGMGEVAPHFFDAGIGVFAGVAVFAVNGDVWAGLQPEVQEIMLEVGRESLPVASDLVETAEAEACDRLLDEGGSVTLLPDEEIEDWRESVFEDNVLSAWRQASIDAGHDEATVDEVFDDFTTAVEQYEEESDFVDGLIACGER